MSLLLLFSLIFAPAVFWVGYFYYHDRFKPEPLVLTGFSYLLGFLSGWLCLRAYDLLVPIFNLSVDIDAIAGLNLSFLLYCILVVGLVEEVFKFIPFRLMMLFSDFNEEIDGIFYSAAVALGFASFENIYYLPALTGSALFGRAIASPLTHTIFATIWGAWVGSRHVHRKPLWPVILGSIALAALLHGLYDFLTFSPPLLRILGALLLLVLWLWRIRTSEWMVQKNKKIFVDRKPE